MWSAISKIFMRNSSINNVQSGDNPSNEVDRGTRRKTDMDDTFITRLVSLPILNNL